MRREFLLLLIFPIVSFGFTSDSFIYHPGVESVVFEKDSVFTVCRWNRYSCQTDQARVKVSSFVKDSESNSLTYYYIPSKGRILGQGANVVWDLSEASPGKYSLTVGVGNDGIINGKTITKTLTVSGCPECDPPRFCPSLSILGPKGTIRPDDAFIVRAKVEGIDKSEITYHWTISSGVIAAGQNADQILIRTAHENVTSPIEVNVEIGGTDPNSNCVTVVSEGFPITK
jgi:hypothetical protein